MKTKSFNSLLKIDKELARLRKEYATKSPQERRQAADRSYYSEYASDLFGKASANMGKETGLFEQQRPSGYAALAIDPDYAAALLTVGSVEYQTGHIKEACQKFLKIADLPHDTEDVHEIIEQVFSFLLEQGDIEGANSFVSRLLNNEPTSSVYRQLKATCLSKMKNLKKQ